MTKRELIQFMDELVELASEENKTTERDFEKSRRKQFVSRIATGDYDCIIMSHTQFEKIPISKERKEVVAMFTFIT